MQNITRLTLLAALLLPGCARTSPDSARTKTPTDAAPVPAGEDPGLEPLGNPVDQVGREEEMTPTDGAAPVRPGTENTGNPGGSTVNEVGSSDKPTATPRP